MAAFLKYTPDFREHGVAGVRDLVRKTKRTCFAFKVLGAGRNIGNPGAIERAFRYVLTHVKPQDPVIVGMCPRFKDEIAENAAIVKKIAGERAT